MVVRRAKGGSVIISLISVDSVQLIAPEVPLGSYCCSPVSIHSIAAFAPSQ